MEERADHIVPVIYIFRTLNYILYINEKCNEEYGFFIEKCLGLWDINEISKRL